MNHLTTINGGKLIIVSFEQDKTPPIEIKVRQIPVREYETGFRLVDDEIALAGFLCQKDKAWAESLAPGSLEDVLEHGREVNERGFFSSCRRRTERLASQNADMLGQMSKLPPETLKLMVELGQKKKLSPSESFSQGSVLPPAA